MKARGIGPEQLLEGTVPGSMELLAEWSDEADHIVAF